MNKVDNLAELLRRVDAGESPTRIKEESKDFLEAVGPLDIVLAQQALVKSGLDCQDIARCCRSHVSLLDNPAERLRRSLPHGHVIQRLLYEHQMVQCFLVDLEDVNAVVSRLPYISGTAREYVRLLHIVSHLSTGDQHIDIEERILFPEMEKMGIFVLPKILTTEHFHLREYTEQLQELIYKCCATDLEQFKRSLDRIVIDIVPLKREHIFKEDNILYPIAFKTVKADSVWNQLNAMCEQVGYSCF
ncbi:MAG: DUF438 domain-containing protein [Planctomycetota bacterium]|jgi:DUF438 domain-containing protein